MIFKIAVLAGDGIGPEVMDCALKVLDKIQEVSDLRLEYHRALIGGIAIDEAGSPFPQETQTLIRTMDAVFLGSVGGPKWDNLPPTQRPEVGGLLAIRKSLDLYANIRPVLVSKQLANLSPLDNQRISEGIDFVVFRELSSGIYFGQPKEKNQTYALDTMRYERTEIERIAVDAFKMAKMRRGKVTSIDKANVLASSQLWREVVEEVHNSQFPEIELEHMYVDNAAMQIMLHPQQFDVMLTSNLFGDILSDAGAALCGSLGLLPTASLGTEIGLYEPAGGSAPDIAGQNIANPIAQILSAAMLLEISLQRKDLGAKIRQAVTSVIESGLHTRDIKTSTSKEIIGTKKITDLICEKIS